MPILIYNIIVYKISKTEMSTRAHPFLPNQIFHDSDMRLSGCLPPKTGSTSWNHFWWGTSLSDAGVYPGKNNFDSFQSQVNTHVTLFFSTKIMDIFRGIKCKENGNLQ